METRQRKTQFMERCLGVTYGWRSLNNKNDYTRVLVVEKF